MVDTARQLLDELMGRNRNLDPATAQCRKIQWDDPEFCLYFLVKFCPHELFVNTRADLGPCPKVHDEEAKRLYEEARPSVRKRHFEDEFIRFSNHMLSEVDRKIAKGKQRLLLMNRTTGGDPQQTPVYVSRFQEQVNNLSARIAKLIGEAEEAGIRGDVDQAQGLMTLCDQLKDEKDALVKQHESTNNGGGGDGGSVTEADRTGGSSSVHSGSGKQSMERSTTAENSPTGSSAGGRSWSQEQRSASLTQPTPQQPEFTSTEKQMEVCEVCGAFLIVGDAQQRLEDHLTGKQHMGYSRLRKAVDEMYEKRKQERDEEDRLRDEERRHKFESGGSRDNKFGRRRDDFDDSRGRGRRDDRDRRDSRSDGDRERRDRGSERHRHRRDDRDDYRDSRDRHRSRSRY